MKQIGVGGFSLSQRAKDLVNQVLDSNRLTPGPMTERFEAEFARIHNVKHALMCNSGTSALHMALAVLKEREGWQDGDEVIVPALTFVATVNAVFHVGLKPVFVDVNDEDFCIDTEKIYESIALTGRTKAVIPVHIGGHPANMKRVQWAAWKSALFIIEDSCESMFVKTDEKAVGAWGAIGCFSTYAAHIISTGVGGVVTTNDDDLFIMMKSYMNHGRDPIYTRIDDDKSGDLSDIVRRRFRFIRMGHSFRSTEMEAALGVAQLEDYKEIIRRRQEIADQFDEAFKDLPIQVQKTREGAENARMWYPIIYDGGYRFTSFSGSPPPYGYRFTLEKKSSNGRDDLVMHLEENGIETRMLLPLLNNPCYKHLGIDRDQFPVAKRLTDNGFDIGCHPEMSDDDVSYVIEKVRGYFQ